NGTLVVSKATATVTLGSLAQTYNGSARTVSATTSPAGLNVTFTYDGSATAPTNAGSYAVVATVTDTNYSGTQNGTLVVSKAAATVTLGSLAQTYDGNPKPATATTSPAGLNITFTYNGSSTAPTNHGTYAVVATINDANHSGSGTGNLVIAGQTTASWRSQQFTPEQISGGLAADTADPDQDAIPNLAEYALGTNPNAHTPPLAPVLDANGLSLVFTRPKDLPNVTYTAQSSENLSSWTPLTLEVVTDGPVQTMRARDNLAVGNPGQRFIRVLFGTP
ncbi:MAG: MBG domain-containing protein, partial [Prosthecobacter sp.]